MTKADVMTTVGKTFHKVGFQLKKHSPEILAVVGVVGTVASAVMACKATTKVKDILDDTKAQVDSVHEVLANENVSEEEYSEQDSKKDLTIIYTQTGLKFIKLYAPSVLLGVASIGCMLTSNNILRKRNLALAAAYTAVDKGFKQYRSRVVDRFGKEVDRQLKYNLKAEEVEETIVDAKGKEKKVKKTITTVDKNTISDYTFLFDETSSCWEKNAEFNQMFLRAQQQYANDLLISRGHLFLNEVLDLLGIDRVKMGNVVGWIYNPETPNGDNYVDFGIFDLYKTSGSTLTPRDNTRDFVNGYERSILLEFNVDGYILDKAF